MKPGLQSWPEREALLVLLIALHSIGVGVLLLFGSHWALRLGGWAEADSLFFVRQGGIFHLIVATLYLVDYFRRDSILPIVIAKSSAVVFLVAMRANGEPALVLVSALIDALMLIAVLSVRVLSRGHDGAGRP
jgi:hypothetical protein